MKNRKYTLHFLCLLLVLCSACNKILDVKPKGKLTLNSAKDFDLWLNAPELTRSGAQELNTLADNYFIPNLILSELNTDANNLIYTWQEQFNTGIQADAEPIFWAKHYHNIYLYNTVINKIDAVSGTPEQKTALKAEAYLGKAFEYLYLVNLYGKVYDASTASVDLAVPIIETNDVSQNTPKRSSVAQIYDYIIANINKALQSNLTDVNNQNKFRGSKAAAHSVLARTYLYMGKYDDAAKQAALAISLSKSVVIDYNGLNNLGDLGSPAINNESIYARFGTNVSENPVVSLWFLNSIDRHDFRYSYFYFDYRDYTPASKDSLVYKTKTDIVYMPYGADFSIASDYNSNFGTSAIEMYLIMAENEARKGNLTEAKRILNTEVKAKRYEKDFIKPIESSDKEVVLNEVFKERLFEYPYNGLRWFDMRRLDKENKMQNIKRLGRADEVLSELKPHSSKYVLKIPAMVLRFNPEMQQK